MIPYTTVLFFSSQTLFFIPLTDCLSDIPKIYSIYFIIILYHTLSILILTLQRERVSLINLVEYFFKTSTLPDACHHYMRPKVYKDFLSHPPFKKKPVRTVWLIYSGSFNFFFFT